jgi:hypothetical protein
MKKQLFLALLAGVLLTLGGCLANKQAAESAPAAPPPPPPPVHLRAYINVSSGCQQTTVDFLHHLAQKYPRVQLELIDFGDGGKGSELWQQSGYKCMTIEINGHSAVKFPAGNKTQAIAFHMPAGFLWNHDDLGHAVQAALAGTLQPATEAELAAQTPPQEVKAKLQELQKSKAAKAKAKAEAGGK